MSASRAVDLWLAGHHGVISASQLRRLGVSSRMARRRIDSGALVPMARGIYRAASHPSGRRQLMVAACLLHPDAALAFTTAGQEWGLRRMRDERVHVLVPHGSSPTLDGVVIHRCRSIDPVDLTAARHDGIRLTSPPRTAHDAAGLIGPDATASVIEQLLAERRCTLSTLLATDRRLFHPRRPGSATLRSVLMARPAWRGAARSDLEMRVREAVERAGLPEPAVNMRVELGGETFFIDLAWPSSLLAVEVDHPFWHDGEREARKDKRRDRLLARDGWQTLRIPLWDVDNALDEAIDDVAVVLERRAGRAPGAA